MEEGTAEANSPDYLSAEETAECQITREFCCVITFICNSNFVYVRMFVEYGIIYLKGLIVVLAKIKNRMRHLLTFCELSF